MELIPYAVIAGIAFWAGWHIRDTKAKCDQIDAAAVREELDAIKAKQARVRGQGGRFVKVGA